MPITGPRRRVSALVLAFSLFALVAGARPVGAEDLPLPNLDVIVTLADSVDSVDAVVADHTEVLGIEVGHIYRSALKGYSASIPSGLLGLLTTDARVAAVELDSVMSISAAQSGATWGIDRLDQRNLPLNGTYTYNNTGGGVTAYIIDTGIRVSHDEFGGRATSGRDFVDDDDNADDCHGHGTHVAGTVGGTTYGVAKTVSLVAVRVLDCGGSGATSGVIAGVDWVTQQHQAGQPAVANMSLGGGGDSALDTAVRNSIADGVSYAVAAGNGNIIGLPVNSCSQSPGRVAEAMTIGASDRNDAKASFSNYGSCVDWHAPGVGIVSAGISSNGATATMSGTSMASPHTAGVAALYLQANPGASPAAVRQALFDLTTKGKVKGTGGGLLGGSTPNNHLLFTNL